MASAWSAPFQVGNNDAPGSTRAAFIDVGKWSIVAGSTTISSLSETALQLAPMAPWKYGHTAADAPVGLHLVWGVTPLAVVVGVGFVACSISVVNSFGVGVNATVYVRAARCCALAVPDMSRWASRLGHPRSSSSNSGARRLTFSALSE